MNSEQAQWDDPAWLEKGDNSWARGCRWLQGWWRENRLSPPLPAGLSLGKRPRTVVSMLPADAGMANFLTPEAAAAAQARLESGETSGIVDRERLLRNLLSSQPACFNLFGPFSARPNGLLAWVQSIDPEAAEVTGIRFEWAPAPERHFGGGSAFDAMIDYRSATGPRFLGVEVKYAENLASTSIKTVRRPYRRFMAENGSLWLEGAERRLDRPHLRQLWFNVLLAQSLVLNGKEHERGTVVVVACAADVSARRATGEVRMELEHSARDQWLQWSPYEDVLAATDQGPWADEFRVRYLDFGPVSHLLAADDPRIAPGPPDLAGLGDLLTAADRVLADGSILEQIDQAVNEGRLDRAALLDLEALSERAGALAADLKTWRQAAHPVWDRIDPADGDVT